MRELLQLYPGDRFLGLLAITLVQTTVIIGLAWAMAALARRNAAIRHAIWLGALAFVLTSPLSTWLIHRAGFSTVTMTLPRGVWPPVAAAEASASEREATAVSDERVRSADLKTFEARPAPADAGDPGLRRPDRALAAPFSIPDRLRLGALLGLGIWGIGVLYLAVRHVGRAAALRRLMREIQPADGEISLEILQEVRHCLSGKPVPSIMVWRDPHACLTPVMVGVVRPVIVLSKAMASSLDGPELRDVLVHECAHVLRLDPVVGLLQWVAGALFWPYPLVRLMNRELARAREEVCDNYVLRHTEGPQYAQTLFDLAQSVVPLSPQLVQFGLFQPNWRLEQRIAGLLDLRRKVMIHANRSTIAALVAAFLSAAALVAGTRILWAEPAAPTASAPAASAPAASAPAASAPAASAELAPIPPEGLQWVCRVVEKGTGKPIDGATVTVRLRVSTQNPAEPYKIFREDNYTTDREGKYTLKIPADVAAERRLYVELDVHHPDYPGKERFGYSLAMIRKNEPLGERPFFEKVELYPGQRTTGQVLTPDGNPAAGIKVVGFWNVMPEKVKEGTSIGDMMSFSHTVTDTEGRFSLALATPGKAVLWIVPEQFAPSQRILKGKRGDLGVFRLEKGIVLRGKLLDAEGKPVASVPIEVAQEQSALNQEVGPVATQISRTALSNAQGEFVFQPLPPGNYTTRVEESYHIPGTERWRRYAVPATFFGREVTLNAGIEPELLVVRAVPHVTITAQYLDSQGKPRSGSEIPLFARMDNHFWFGYGRPNSNGRAVMIVPKGAEVQLDLITNEHSSLRYKLGKDAAFQYGRHVKFEKLEKDVPELLIYRYTAPIVLARLTAKDGGELKDVTIRGRYKRIVPQEKIDFERQDVDGRYRSSQLLPDEETTITATAEGYKAAETTLSLPEGKIQEIELTLEKK